jgi:arsenate reductase
MMPSKHKFSLQLRRKYYPYPENITQERKAVLQPLIDYIQIKASNQEEIRLNFICTHNSRRSHLSQVWAQTASSYFNISNVFCYSGGTEATALFPMAAKNIGNIWI